MWDLGSLTGMEPVLPAVEAQSPNYWTAREFPEATIFNSLVCFWNLLLCL